MRGKSHLVARGILAFSLLSDVEAEVLQEEDGPGGGVSTGSFHFRTHTVLQEGDVAAERGWTIHQISLAELEYDMNTKGQPEENKSNKHPTFPAGS